VSKLYYTVHDDAEGKIAVSSLMGRTKAEEKKFAASLYPVVYGVFEDCDVAQEVASRALIAKRKAVRA
jgi:hypothetical protein